MVFRVKVRLGRPGDAGRAGRQLASKVAAFMTPAALCALLLASWRLGADLGWTGEFAITTGFFSHWQVWMALSGGLQVCASALNRYATRGRPRATHAAPPLRRPPAAQRPEGPGVTRMPDPALRTRPPAPPEARSARRLPDTYPVKDRTYF